MEKLQKVFFLLQRLTIFLGDSSLVYSYYDVRNKCKVTFLLYEETMKYNSAKQRKTSLRNRTAAG